MPKIRDEGVPIDAGWYWLEGPDSLAPTCHQLRWIAGRLVFSGGTYSALPIDREGFKDYRFQRVKAPDVE